MHSETQPLCSLLKIPLFPPPWVGERVGRPRYTHRPALTSTVPPCPQQREMFCLYHPPIMWNVLVWLQNMVLFPDHSHKTYSPQSPPFSLSVLSMCDLRNHVKICPGKAGMMPSLCSAKSGWTRSLLDYNFIMCIAVQRERLILMYLVDDAVSCSIVQFIFQFNKYIGKITTT